MDRVVAQGLEQGQGPRVGDPESALVAAIARGAGHARLLRAQLGVQRIVASVAVECEQPPIEPAETPAVDRGAIGAAIVAPVTGCSCV
jgi:hypothetical protein